MSRIKVIKSYFRENILLLFLGLFVVFWAFSTNEMVFDLSDELLFYINVGVGDYKGFTLANIEDFSPIYNLWYSILRLFTDSIPDMFAFNSFFVLSMLPLLVIYYLSKLGFSYAGIFLSMGLFTINSVQYLTSRRISHFAMVLIVLFAIVSLRFKEKYYKFWVMSIGALYASYVRPEYIVAFYFLSLFTVFYFLKSYFSGNRFNKKIIVALVVFSLTPAVLFNVFDAANTGRGKGIGVESGNGRGIYTFLVKNKEMRLLGKSFKDYNDLGELKIVIKEYGNPKNIFEAMSYNPNKFFKYVRFNLIRLYLCFKEFFTGYDYLKIFVINEWVDGFSVIVGLAALLALLKILSIRRGNIFGAFRKPKQFDFLIFTSVLILPQIVVGSLITTMPAYITGIFLIFLITFFEVVSIAKPKIITGFILIFFTMFLILSTNSLSTMHIVPVSSIELKSARILTKFHKKFPDENILITCKFYQAGMHLGFDSNVDELCCYDYDDGYQFSSCPRLARKPKIVYAKLNNEITSGKWAVLSFITEGENHYKDRSILSNVTWRFQEHIFKNFEKYGFVKVVFQKFGHQETFFVRPNFKKFFDKSLHFSF